MEPQRGIPIVNQQSKFNNQKLKADHIPAPQTMWRRAPSPVQRSRRQAPRPRTPLQHDPNHHLPRHNPPPVSRSRQRRRSRSRPTESPQPDRRTHARRTRLKQPIQRRPRPRQRRILRARAQKRPLATTQLGIFRKDDLFKVVFYPSPDKPEKRILGPTPSRQSRRSTGVPLAQPRRQPATKLTHSIGP